MTRPDTLIPVSSGLDLDWQRREREIGKTSAQYQEVRELADGFAYRYPAGPRWTERMQEVRDHLTHHYPFFNIDVDVAQDGAVWLRITGPEGAKEILQRGLDHAAGKVEKDGTETASFWERVLVLGGRYLTSPWRVLPDFLIIGAAKAGTTSLYSYLSQHPQVAPAFRKELYFFDMNWRRGVRYYRAHFPTVFAQRRAARRGERLFAGEATPCYLFSPHAPERVWQTVPRARLLALLRDPAQRAYSYWCMNARRGLETLGFAEAIAREDQRLAGELEKMQRDPSYFSLARHHGSYLARGLYAEQLRNWLRFFPRDQLLVLSNEELETKRDETLARAQEFIGLPVRQLHDTGRRNYIPYPKLDAAVRRRLADYYRPHNEELFALLGHRYDWGE